MLKTVRDACEPHKGPLISARTSRSRISRRCSTTRPKTGHFMPDAIKDDWIDDIERLDERMAEFIERKRRLNAFDIRYNDTIDPGGAGGTSDERW